MFKIVLDYKRQKEKQGIHKRANKKERQSDDQLFNSNPAGRPKVHTQAIYDYKLQTFMLHKKVIVTNKLNSHGADSL